MRPSLECSGRTLSCGCCLVLGTVRDTGDGGGDSGCEDDVRRDGDACAVAHVAKVDSKDDDVVSKWPS